MKKQKLSEDYRYGYDDQPEAPELKIKPFALLLSLLFLTGAWLYLDHEILFGEDWISETYDGQNWRTNEGNLMTYGAWDLEAHIWKSVFIMENWPNINWNPYWYLGMPLLKYYQAGFYGVHIGAIELLDVSPARAASLIIVFGHFLATLMTFLLCLRISRKYALSALCAFFVLANTFMSLRSYGWEPITVVFLFLFPLGLLVFLKQPLRPMRFWMVMLLALSYLMHPLIWFSLCLSMGLYIIYMKVHASMSKRDIGEHHTITQFIAAAVLSLLLGAVQSFNQFSYDQVTSGAHMGVSYLPFYHVPFNVLSLQEFFFGVVNLKGPGPIVMLAFLFLLVFGFRRRNRARDMVDNHPLIRGLALVTGVMVLLYFLEAYNIFPMNIIRSVQYHRIIPEFIVISAALISATAVLIKTRAAKIFYYCTLISFVIAGLLVIGTVQTQWKTVDSIEDKPEFIYEDFEGRISMPYTEQSLSVRNSYTEIPQVYGYYEQGVTNSYADELFSVSSGFHEEEDITLYLQAAGVTRLYVNTQAGIRNEMMERRLQDTYLQTPHNERYGYYSIPNPDPSLAQAVSMLGVRQLEQLEPGCRELYKEVYCGSVHEEFVRVDPAEKQYLRAYVDLLAEPYPAQAEMQMQDPDHYLISVANATEDTAVIVKMTKDDSWQATIAGEQEELSISPIGPDFFVIEPQRSGDYEIQLTYRTPRTIIAGAIVSVLTFIGLCIFFIRRPDGNFPLPAGDMEVHDETK